MRLTVPGVAALLALALVGCKQEDPIGGKPRDPAEMQKAVVSLSPSTTEIAFATNFNAQLKGRTDADDFPMQAAKVPVVVHNTKIDYEMLAGIKPRVILYDATLYSDAEVAKLKETGAELAPFNAHTLEEYEAYVRKVSLYMGGEMNASEYMDKVYAARDISKGAMAGTDVKVMVLMGGTGGELMATGTESILADFVRNAGGNIQGPKGDRFVPVNVEEIIKADPAIIFCPEDSYDAVAKDPRLANVTAVKNGKVKPVKSGILLRAGSRVDMLIGSLGAEIQLAGGVVK